MHRSQEDIRSSYSISHFVAQRSVFPKPMTPNEEGSNEVKNLFPSLPFPSLHRRFIGDYSSNDRADVEWPRIQKISLSISDGCQPVTCKIVLFSTIHIDKLIRHSSPDIANAVIGKADGKTCALICLGKGMSVLLHRRNSTNR